ncbi:hypothetical protein FKP32DRAFT_1028110 [Trametes sanguinea]|nr:hypothetical protein FKP32DRAFT_1028110 [Trametes sanguinea]
MNFRESFAPMRALPVSWYGTYPCLRIAWQRLAPRSRPTIFLPFKCVTPDPPSPREHIRFPKRALPRKEDRRPASVPECNNPMDVRLSFSIIHVATRNSRASKWGYSSAGFEDRRGSSLINSATLTTRSVALLPVGHSLLEADRCLSGVRRRAAVIQNLV